MKIHYFNGYGRAESIRMLLSIAKVPYEDVSYTDAEWGKAKHSGKFEFGQMPVLELESGETLA